MLCNAICEKSYLQRRKHPTWFKDLPFGLAQLSIPISFCFFSLLIQLLHILFFALFFPCHFPLILLHPSLFSDLFISTFLFIILPMYKKKDRKGKSIHQHKAVESYCAGGGMLTIKQFSLRYSMNSVSLPLSASHTHIISRLSPFTKSVSSPFLRLFFHSFCIFSQP